MSPQLTLQTPLQLPPEEIPDYLNQLWSEDVTENIGANTFCLIVWQPAWIEQQLIRIGRINGPVTGTQRSDIIEEARQIILEEDLPHITPPFDKDIATLLSKKDGTKKIEDLRGQHIDSAISSLQPRRLITIAPSIYENSNLQALVAAYCPLPEEGGGENACGDVVVLRGSQKSLDDGLVILNKLLPKELPAWLWWNGNLDEGSELFKNLDTLERRLIIDTALGEPLNCLDILNKKVHEGKAINDLNWLRLRCWRESLAMVFDPPERRNALNSIVKVDIDVEGVNPVQGLLLVAWIADRLNWDIKNCNKASEGKIKANFIRSDGVIVDFNLMPLPIGKPGIHPGKIIGLRLISDNKAAFSKGLCVILGAESGECMRLEAGGMASMELLEEVVYSNIISVEKDVARLLSSSRGTTSPLLASAAPIAKKLFDLASLK